MKTVINHYETRNRVFTIVYDQDHYLAIEDKYLDENGCMKQALNGFQMHADRDLRRSCWMDELISEGFSQAEAFCTVNGMECTDQIRELFGNW